MAGLLDGLNFDDPTTQGLLSAAAQMFAASGPSRTPTSLGQILGQGYAGGLQGYQGAIQRKQQADLLKQKLDTDQLQNQGLRLDIGAKQAAAAENQRYQDFLKSRQIGQLSPQVAQPQLNPQDFLANGQGPTNDNLASFNQANAPLPQKEVPVTQSNPLFANYQRHLSTAQALEQAGFPDKAAAAYDLAEKSKPKIKDQKTLIQNGQPVNVITYEDGTQTVSQFGALPDNQIVNLGGKQIVVDKNQAQNGQSFVNTQTPDSIANNALTRARLNFDQLQAQRPQYNQEAGGFISPPSAQNPGGVLTPLAGYTKPDKPLTESQGKAATFASRMDAANENINKLVAGGTLTPSIAKQTAAGIPLIGGALSQSLNFTASPKQQQMEQSQRDFVNAILRQESGAAISPSEFSSAALQYFPQPGDSQEVISQKAENRQRAIEGMATQSGPGAEKLGVNMNRKTATLKDIMDTVNSPEGKARGKTTAQVTADLRAAGYKIVGGQ